MAVGLAAGACQSTSSSSRLAASTSTGHIAEPSIKETARAGQDWRADPGNVELGLSYAANLQALGQTDDQLKVLDELARRNPDDAKLGAYYGKQLIHHGRAADGERILRGVVDSGQADWTVRRARFLGPDSPGGVVEPVELGHVEDAVSGRGRLFLLSGAGELNLRGDGLGGIPCERLPEAIEWPMQRVGDCGEQVGEGALELFRERAPYGLAVGVECRLPGEEDEAPGSDRLGVRARRARSALARELHGRWGLLPDAPGLPEANAHAREYAGHLTSALRAGLQVSPAPIVHARKAGQGTRPLAVLGLDEEITYRALTDLVLSGVTFDRTPEAYVKFTKAPIEYARSISDAPLAAIFGASTEVSHVIKTDIAYLHERLLGEKVDKNSEEVTRTYNLFLDVWKDGKANVVPIDTESYWGAGWPWECVATRNYLTGISIPEELRLEVDDLYTGRAWQAVLAYMLTDYNFLYE